MNRLLLRPYIKTKKIEKLIISTELSNKIKSVNILSMFMVVFIHSKFINSRFQDALVSENGITHKINIIFQYIISEEISRIAVPIFFVLSSFLFYKDFEDSFLGYKIKVLKRIRSIVIPYFTWSILWAFIYSLMNQISFVEFVKYVLIPVPYQFWFLQVLVVLVLLSGVIWKLILKYNFKLLIVLLLIYLSLYLNRRYYIDYLFFWSLGGYLAFYLRKRKAFNAKLIFLLFLIWISLVSINTFIYDIKNQISTIAFILLHRIGVLFGVFFAITILFFNNSKFSFLNKYSKYSFFLFCLHEPLLSFIKSWSIEAIKMNDENQLMCYILIPTLLIIFCLWLGSILEKKIPKVYNTLIGYRL